MKEALLELAPPPPPTVKRGALGAMLLAAGCVSEEVLTSALAEQRVTGERIGSVLVRLGVDPEDVARMLALQVRMRYLPPPLHVSSPRCLRGGWVRCRSAATSDP